MANCARCGRELASFSVGDLPELCPDCRAVRRSNLRSQAPVAGQGVGPVTTALLAVNVLVFVAMAVIAHTLREPPNSLLLQWGANWGPLSLDGQRWRILTSNYVHIGIWHIAFNMWALWQLGWLSERIFGGWTYLLVYTLCGIAGSLASLFRAPLVLGAGASGAIFGLVGALISALYLGRLPFPEVARKRLLRTLLIVVAVNLYLGATFPGIDNAAHMGGLWMGLGLGAALAPYLTAHPDRRRGYQSLIFITSSILLLGAGSLVERRNGYVVFASRADQAMSRAELDQAIGNLQQAVAKNPGNKTALGLLGQAYLQRKDYSSAETALQRVLALDPGDATAQYNLGLIYGTTGRYEEARQMFARLAEQDPKDDEIWVLLGSSLDELGREPEAVQALQRAIALNPRNGAAYRELGLAQRKLQQTDAAVTSLEKAARLDPANAETEKELAQAYLQAGRREEAANAFQKAAKLAPPQGNEPGGTKP